MSGSVSSRPVALARNEQAVSEIVGSSLILAITVLLFSVLIVYVATLKGPDEQRFVDLQAELTLGSGSGTLSITHAGGEQLLENLTLIQVTLDNNVTNLNLTQGGVGLKWNMGEKWSWTSAKIASNTSVELRVIEKSARLNRVLLTQTLQSGSGSGSHAPVIHLAWTDPDVVVADGSSSYRLEAYVTDEDLDLNASGGGMVNLAAVGGGAAVSLSDPDGDGTFVSAPQTPAKSLAPGRYLLTLTFTDATGKTDMVKVVLKVRSLDLLYSLSDGITGLYEPTTYGASVTVESAGGAGAYTALGLADADGDGDSDVAAGSASKALHYWENDGTWDTPVVVSADVGSAVNELVWANVSGSSNPEIVIGTAGGSVVWYSASAGAAANNLITGLNAVHALAAQDMDGDGDLDLVVGTTNKVLYLANDGSWTRTDIITGLAGEVHSLVAGDFGVGTATADVAFGTTDNKVYLFESGAAWTNRTVDADVGPAAQVEALAAGDLDGDGDLDLVAGTNGSKVVRYLHGGATSWSEHTLDASAGGGVVDLTVAEVDGDGNPDVVAAAGTQLNWYANDQLWTRSVVTTLSGSAGRLVTGEVNHRA